MLIVVGEEERRQEKRTNTTGVVLCCVVLFFCAFLANPCRAVLAVFAVFADPVAGITHVSYMYCTCTVLYRKFTT